MTTPEGGRRGRRLGQPKTGGRVAGMPNRTTLALKEKLPSLNCDPMEEFAKIARDPKTDSGTNVNIDFSLTGHTSPILKAVGDSNQEFGTGDESAPAAPNPNPLGGGPDKIRREVSPRKMVANRKNALRSTGPRTPEGKRTVRRNAVRHGVLSNQIDMLPGETSHEFESLRMKLRNGIGPKNESEEQLVRNAAVLIWKLRRCTRVQDSLLPAAGLDAPWRTMLRYGGSLSRQLRKVICGISNLQQSEKE